VETFQKFRDPVLRELLTQSQVVIADFPFTFPVIQSGQYEPVVGAVDAADGHSRKTFVLNTHNIEHHVVAAPFQRSWVKRIEDLAAKRAQLVIACSQSDAAYFRPHARESVLVVPNGIDLSRFALAAEERASVRGGLRAQLGISQQTVILFSASSYGPNSVGFEYLKHFCLTNQQLLLSRSVTFLVVGSVSSHAMVLPGMIVTGKVDRVEPYFYASDLAVNPIFEGGGTSVKVAESLAAGLPMLTTRVGSRGYALEDGTSCFIFCQETLREKLEHMLDHRDVVSLAEEALSKNRQFIDMRFAIVPLVDRIAALAEPALSP
jgi:glycosyltransferase involved in cell wall biosynthesis